MESHPVRVRGLKRGIDGRYACPVFVAPCTGAWIETPPCTLALLPGHASHPVRVRGLKLPDKLCARLVDVSHPVRVRGLKHAHKPSAHHRPPGRTLYGCVD